MRIHLAQLAAAIALAGAMPAMVSAQTPAQSWPQRSIKMIVPFPAGGGTDFIARIAAKHLSDRLGQQVFVENRGGANGAIGLQALMQSDPDGYTIATCSDTPLVVNPSLYEKLAYAPRVTSCRLRIWCASRGCSPCIHRCRRARWRN
jgi:tripartite-type tricarboxylate transporter receptor subunit TctC